MLKVHNDGDDLLFYNFQHYLSYIETMEGW